MVEAGAPGLPIGSILPFISMFAVANSALINMLMASRLLYGMAQAARAAAGARQGAPDPPDAVGGDPVHHGARLRADRLRVARQPATRSRTLGGTTALLLLGVFAVVNIAVLVLRKDDVGKKHFRAPTVLPIIGIDHLPVPGHPAVRPGQPRSTWSPAGCW